MRFYEAGTENGPIHIIELTERNLRALLEKLEDPNSVRTLMDPDRKIFVRAVPDSEHYADRNPGPVFTNGEYR